MTTTYKIGFKGKLRSGFDEETILGNLESIFKMDRTTGKQLLLTEKPVVLKRGLDRPKAERIGRLFQMAGLLVELVPEKNEEEDTEVTPTPSPVKKSKIFNVQKIKDFFRRLFESAEKVDIPQEELQDQPDEIL